MQCPCGSNLDYAKCCEPFISGSELAPTAEALMRSRYTAHVIFSGRYLRDTLAPETRNDYDEKSVEEWAKQSEWLGLKILSSEAGKATDSTGVVEFQATYKTQGKVYEHHEVAKFRKDPKTSRWYFVDGEAHTHEEGQGHQDQHAPKTPTVREGPKVGRNDPCTCGSGKKFKKCCGVAA